MRILSVAATPLFEIPYLAAAPRGGSEPRSLAVLHATVDALPPGLDAIVATSDLQGVTPSLRDGGAAVLLGEVLAFELAAHAEKGTLPSPERMGVLLAGDLFSSPAGDVRGASGDVRDVWLAFADEVRWVAGVTGNHDELGSPKDRARFAARGGVHLLDDTTTAIDGLRVGGVAGIIGREGKPGRRSAEAFLAALDGVLTSMPDIVVLHEGPEGTSPRGANMRGNTEIGNALRAAPTALVVCGHVHWEEPFAVHPAGPHVLNVDGRAVVMTRASR